MEVVPGKPLRLLFVAIAHDREGSEGTAHDPAAAVTDALEQARRAFADPLDD